ncbi:MAG: hypothetical protein ACKPBB_11040 [Sphaerospermopsis kisseleviana]
MQYHNFYLSESGCPGFEDLQDFLVILIIGIWGMVGIWRSLLLRKISHDLQNL